MARPGSHARPPRFFVDALPPAAQALSLPALAAQHLRVLRLSPGAEVELFDGRGGAAQAVLLAGDGARVRCAAPVQSPPPVAPLTLVVGLPKGQKLDGVLRMLTELGVDALQLAHSERSVPTPGDFDARLQRLQRIAREACAQSRQPFVPAIEPPRPLPEVAAAAPAGAQRLLFWERAEAPLPAALAAPPAGTWAVIGPEGGLSDAEAAALQSAGYAPVGLGPGILRAETAAVAIATLLLDRLGRLG